MNKTVIISIILILFSITTKAQSTSDSIQILTKKFELLEKNTYNAGIEIQNFYYFQTNSIIYTCVGIGSSTIGAYFLSTDNFLTKNSDFSYIPSMIFFTISAFTLTTGIVYHFKSLKSLKNAGLELTSGINQVGLKVNF
ncbi:MAG: hypothetical protein H6Q25_807 [Bacteroidetes bacterium]|nr:hypothetical protein [Bacteroidota bacterium]